MKKPKIYADFHNADEQGRLRLNCTGTIEDLAWQRVHLQLGQTLLFYSEDLEVEGTVAYSPEEGSGLPLLIGMIFMRWHKLINCYLLLPTNENRKDDY